MPDGLKEQVRQKFKVFLDWLDETKQPAYVLKQGRSIVESIEKYMMGESYNSEYWAQFVRYTKELDEIRDQDLLITCPEFKGFLEP